MPYCNNCGASYTVGEERCGKCGGSLPSPAGQPRVLEARELRNPVGKRLVAGLIDLAIAVGMFTALFFSRRLLLMIIFRRSLAILIPHLYLLVKDAIEGKSIGKLLTGVMVFQEKEGKPGGPLDSIIRNWYLAIPLLGPTLIALVIGAQILSGKQRRMGDDAAGTIVITDADYQALR